MSQRTIQIPIKPRAMFQLKLLEKLLDDETGTTILRLPGGWMVTAIVATMNTPNGAIPQTATIFVPYSEEGQLPQDKETRNAFHESLNECVHSEEIVKYADARYFYATCQNEDCDLVTKVSRADINDHNIIDWDIPKFEIPVDYKYEPPDPV